MRGQTLGTLIDDLTVEVGHSANPAHGLSARDWLKGLIRRTQRELWEEYDWEHLNVVRDIALQEGQRFYNVPSDLSAERIERVSFRYGSRWVPVSYGIDEDDYSARDSDVLDVRTWPIKKWRMSEDPQDVAGNVDDVGMIEVWPSPPADADTAIGTLRLRGTRKIRELNVDSDRCEIDGSLIVLTAAAEVLARENERDAQIKLQKADRLRARLQGQSTNKNKHTLMTPDCGEGAPGFGANVQDLPAFIGER